MMPVVRVKICGVTTLENALMVAESGVDMIGLNFYKPSPRYITPPDAQALCDGLRARLGEACPMLVGVFVNESVGTISQITNQVGLDAAQLSGDESVEMLSELRGIAYKAIRPMNQAMALDDAQYYAPQSPTDERLPSLLLDAYHPQLYGGTGEVTSVEVALAVKAHTPRLMLAGGLTPENIADRVREIRPWGVDVAGGVESTPGTKDPSKVRALIAALARG